MSLLVLDCLSSLCFVTFSVFAAIITSLCFIEHFPSTPNGLCRFQHTPHDVVLAWMRDCLDLWKEAGWGWALWNLRGGFGILDSNRADVATADFHGHALDTQLLELLQRY